MLLELDTLVVAAGAPGKDGDCAACVETREDSRVIGRENWTEIDNLPPSVSIGPPKSKKSLSDEGFVVRGKALVRRYISSLRSLLQNRGMSRSMAHRLRPRQHMSRCEAGRCGACAPEGCGENLIHHTSSSVMSYLNYRNEGMMLYNMRQMRSAYGWSSLSVLGQRTGGGS